MSKGTGNILLVGQVDDETFTVIYTFFSWVKINFNVRKVRISRYTYYVYIYKFVHDHIIKKNNLHITLPVTVCESGLAFATVKKSVQVLLIVMHFFGWERALMSHLWIVISRPKILKTGRSCTQSIARRGKFPQFCRNNSAGKISAYCIKRSNILIPKTASATLKPFSFCWK